MPEYNDDYKRYVQQERELRRIRREQGYVAPAPDGTEGASPIPDPDAPPVFAAPIVEPPIPPTSPYKDAGGSG